jgi:hypothetical protein
MWRYKANSPQNWSGSLRQRGSNFFNSKSNMPAGRCPRKTFIDRSHMLVVDMIQGVAAKVLSSPNPTHCGGHPRDVEARERNHLRAPGHNPLRQEIQQQKNTVAELQRCETTGPDDPTIARIEAERLKLHELKLKLAVAKQMEVNLDITNARQRCEDCGTRRWRRNEQSDWALLLRRRGARA